MSQSGITNSPPAATSLPRERNMPSMNTPMNFCPSCAPCMNAIAAAPTICAPPKKPAVRRRSNRRATSTTSFTTT